MKDTTKLVEFDLERFKNGEPAYYYDITYFDPSQKRTYVGMENDRIVVNNHGAPINVKVGNCVYESVSLAYANSNWRMMPKEEWATIIKKSSEDKYITPMRVHDSREAAEKSIMERAIPEDWEVVRIIREEN